MIGNARGSHSSPGIYTKEIDLSYASKSLGITTLGVVGETLKGPAFEPIKIENWRDFVNYFGGTSSEKFSGSQYPKYELPYIAKSYLKNSNQLEVCRVLGLSGYNAGPAWLITASDSADTADTKYVVAVLRSRGSYEGNGNSIDPCTGTTDYDTLTYFAEDVTVSAYTSAIVEAMCGKDPMSGETKTYFNIDALNYGRFTLKINKDTDNNDEDVYEYSYPVSLNPGDKDYILNVLGSNPSDGTAAVFVEELYDVALAQMIANGKVNKVNKINSGVTDTINWGLDKNNTPKKPDHEAVLALYDEKLELTVANVGQRFLVEETKESGFTAGDIVVATADKSSGKRVFKYEKIMITPAEGNEGDADYKPAEYEKLVSGDTVHVLSEDRMYIMTDKSNVVKLTDINDYKEGFRCASTPWIVSELKGDKDVIEVKKLFRFHTITDGNAANKEVKISIQNIRPDEGLFDVVVRAFDDMDSTPAVLERFTKCSMVPGTPNFIGFKIGTFDGEYIVKSKYITVEVIANETTEPCVPAGFLGYPMRDWGEKAENPKMGYNVIVDEDIKPKKQYFGFSNIMGIDVDLFNYKGKNAYDNIDSLSEGFHLDSRIKSFGLTDKLIVDGETGFKFSVVDPNNTVGNGKGKTPMFGTEFDMAGTIYEDVNLRKFTVCFYGGFDGWDPYRTSRTNGDKFKANKYKGEISNGFGRNFSQINNPDGLELSGKCITSDYYAYLAGARQFCNPEAVDINVFCTPGIDYVNQTMLSQEILSMIEEERGDSLYIMTTPDKPFGNSDNDMYYPDEAVSNLEDAEIDSSYAATYYPWVKYYDADNSVYINLPATKDAVSAMAYTDNISYPWFAPAGTVRGSVECERAHYITKLEDEDTLYDGMINPIKTFASDGVKIWGQKTMYDNDTPLNRINVRRLMLRVKKLITGACRRLIFEQNDATVKAQFEGLVKPILDDIKSKRGIYDYRLEVNDSAEARDRLELPAIIYIKPTKALEYLSIDFVIMPESVSFNE